MSRFGTPGQLCAWAGVAPASYESAGKRRPAGTRHGSQWLRHALIEAARAAVHTKNSYYAAQYARIARRRGPNKAAVAVANSMLFTIWHLLSNGTLYEVKGAKMCTAATDRGHRRGPWRGPEAGAAGNSKAETNREPVPPRKCLWRRVAGVRYDA